MIRRVDVWAVESLVSNINRTQRAAIVPMGVYVFALGEYIKIGKYSKDNPWSRVVHRGFRSVRCPVEIATMSKDEQIRRLDLVAWFRDLDGKHEKQCHRYMHKYRVCGEWYKLVGSERAVAYLKSRGRQTHVTCEHKTAAMRSRRRL